MRSGAAVACLALLAPLALAQSTAPPRSRPRSAPESVAAARRAQRDFELRRRDRMPTWPGGSGGPCDVRIGRLCYWDNNHEIPPPLEPAAIATARDALIERLSRAAHDDSTSDWVAGQSVRYLVEARRWDDALRAATACRGTAWWCAALRGFAWHERSDHAAAAAAFDSALALMPSAERCRWTDLAWWLEGALERSYKRQPCGPARDAWERRFWVAARPLLSLPGNDLRSELLARRTMSRIRSEGAIEYQMAWGDDLAESEVRFGWPTAWSAADRTMMLGSESRSVIGHEPTPSYAFVPRADAVESPTTSEADDWELDARLPAMRYAPRYAWRGVRPLEHQLARFRRGDSTLVVGAWSVARDGVWHGDSARADSARDLRRRMPRDSTRPDTLRAALVLVDTAGRMTTVARDSATTAGALIVAVPRAAYLASVELLAPARGRAARARTGLAPLPRDTVVSDLLLLAHAAAPGATVEQLARDALGTHTIVAGMPVGLYWETYLPRADSAEVTVQATRIDAAWYARLGRALKLAGGPPTPVAVRFVDAARPNDVAAARSLALTWPPDATGTYRLEVTVRTGDRAATATDTVRVVRD
ncbi:hypothetical protein J421_0491 [Gemmatirosa kalamazoonensis]|uniref:GWxTD domain-containing protein n=1 Tax=Gemmatirosa kalamazoonensis TaxID=861299 RepID=W0RF65_9BACT|nr:hypothetical protein [Gemmatirosa kalamazoonensis]AHG88028.1 hypothetical protein J421_0491 [Gemmatirosa kalamazoonensis]